MQFWLTNIVIKHTLYAIVTIDFKQLFIWHDVCYYYNTMTKSQKIGFKNTTQDIVVSSPNVPVFCVLTSLNINDIVKHERSKKYIKGRNKMKTVTELKKDLVVGKKLTLVYNSLSDTSETIKNRLGKTREIVQIQTNGIWLKSGDVTSKKSFLEFPCASLIEYCGNTIKFYKCGQRELTEEEKHLIDNEPSKRKENSELAYRDAISDGSQTYYMDKKYYKEHNAEWRWDWSKGLRYDINNGKMWDKKIKGDLDLEYIIEQ